MVVGGGSGGHITPNLVIADLLVQRHPNIRLVYVGQKGDKLRDISATYPVITKQYDIYAGKYRRFYKQRLLQRLSPGRHVLNIRDALFTTIGILQSLYVLSREKPQAIFIKGGFVGVPIGIAAAILHIPFLTHDSDVLPGLANRIIGRWARYHAVSAAESQRYYPDGRAIVTGTIVSKDYKLVDIKTQAEYKIEVGYKANDFVVYITGGGLGALRLNTAVASIADSVLDNKNMHIVHLSGRGKQEILEQAYDNLEASKRARVKVMDFINDSYRYSAAADLIVSRAGATTLAEYAIQAKPCIVVPNPHLTGGHQLLNAEALRKAGAIYVVHEDARLESSLKEAITYLFQHPEERQIMTEKLHTKLPENASSKIVALLEELAGI